MIRFLVAYEGPASGCWVQLAWTEFRGLADELASRAGGHVFDLAECWALWGWTR